MVSEPIDVFDNAAIERMVIRLGVSIQVILIRLTELDVNLPEP
jgi:hypothetical protein